MYEDDKDKTNILSDEERRSFSGVTIDEDGRIYEERDEERNEDPFRRFETNPGIGSVKGFHILGKKAKWTLFSLLILVVLLVLSFLFIAGKYLLYAVVIFYGLRWLLKKF